MSGISGLLAKRMLRLKPSATRAMADKAIQAEAAGKKVISFTTGEPDFASPPAAKEYALKAIHDDRSHYTPTGGIPELKQAIAEYYETRHNLKFAPGEIIVGAGAKPILFEALGALLDAGDEVIVPTPAWVSYVEQIDVFDGKAVLVDFAATGLTPRIEDIAAAVTPRTKAVLLNSPHNPTGAIFPRAFMSDLCRLAREKNFMVINDEIYEYLCYDAEGYTNPLNDVPEARDVLLTVNGVSKTFAMTGWRIGYALGPKEFIAKMTSLQSHMTSCASSVSQWAAVGALKEALPDADRMLEEYRKRMEYVYGELSTMPLVKVAKPKGAFYFFVDVRGCLGKSVSGVTVTDDVVFCELLLEHGLVGMVAGAAFLCPGYARMSYATSMDNLRAGMANLRSFLERLG